MIKLRMEGGWKEDGRRMEGGLKGMEGGGWKKGGRKMEVVWKEDGRRMEGGGWKELCLVRHSV